MKYEIISKIDFDKKLLENDLEFKEKLSKISYMCEFSDNFSLIY
jgi:hypothetical protein